MTTLKKSISVFLTLLMIAGIFFVVPITASAEECGDWVYTLLDNETAEIIGYSGSETNLTIPSELDGKKVTSIGDYAFVYCSWLTSVNIPDSVTSIGTDAFTHTFLKSVTIPESVTSIGDRAFGYYIDDLEHYQTFDDFTIYGYEGSAANDYARENDFIFVKIGEESNVTQPSTDTPSEPVTTEPTQPSTDTPSEPIVTEPQTTAPENPAPAVKPAVKKKANPVKVSVKLKQSSSKS